MIIFVLRYFWKKVEHLQYTHVLKYRILWWNDADCCCCCAVQNTSSSAVTDEPAWHAASRQTAKF